MGLNTFLYHGKGKWSTKFSRLLLRGVHFPSQWHIWSLYIAHVSLRVNYIFNSQLYKFGINYFFRMKRFQLQLRTVCLIVNPWWAIFFLLLNNYRTRLFWIKLDFDKSISRYWGYIFIVKTKTIEPKLRKKHVTFWYLQPMLLLGRTRSLSLLRPARFITKQRTVDASTV